MAKDGSSRGGRRTGAGRRPKSGEQIAELPGKELSGAVLPCADVPEPDEYLSARQHDGVPFGAEKIYQDTWLWLKARDCEKIVNRRLIESYAQAYARYIQCENALSEYGLLGKHPTTGAAIASPFVGMSQQFLRQANMLWFEIYDLVKQNGAADAERAKEDVMEQLLSKRNKE